MMTKKGIMKWKVDFRCPLKISMWLTLTTLQRKIPKDEFRQIVRKKSHYWHANFK
jgi:hypothetical protein